MRKSQWILLSLLAAVVASAACSQAPAADTTPSVAVEVTAVAREPVQQWVRTQAVLYPLQQAIITPKISAPVERFFVQRGDRVHAGEEVAQLENSDLKATDEEAQAQLQAAQANYKTAVAGTIPAQLKSAQLAVMAAQQAQANAQTIADSRKQLFAQGALPKRTLDQARVNLTDAQNATVLAQQHLQALEQGGHAAALRAAAATLASAQAGAAAAAAQLSFSTITSPISGVVTDRPVYEGELATSAAPLMTIMNLSQVVARTHLPASEAALLRPGDRATLTGPAGKEFAAKVTIVSAATDLGSTTVQVWVQAANPQQALRPGTTVTTAMLARTLPGALVIPPSALLTDTSGATTVMVVGKDNHAHTRAVTAGVRGPHEIQILKGLQAGERVVSAGAYALADGTPVTILSTGAGPRAAQPRGPLGAQP
ncbi:MAG: efflux RND transporter periplasmic adaptor subunit [Terriglobales bacterium]